MKFSKSSVHFLGLGLLLSSLSPLQLAQAQTQKDKEREESLIRKIVREELNKVEDSGDKSKTAIEKEEDAEAVKQLKEYQEKEAAEHKQGPFDLYIHGYGDIRFAYYDYPEQIDPEEGSRGDSRVGFDTSRFTIELEGEHEPSGVEFEAEVEFEHGGTGSSFELEQDEFGEFEQGVEKGGEVILEEVYLKKELPQGFSVRAGRFYLAVGLLTDYHLPTDYYATGRSEAETTVIPAVWDEIGFEVKKDFKDVGAITLQLVNGLDSTGFSATQWTSSGHQEKFENTRAEDLALVARADFTGIENLLVGVSGYIGNSSGNRPKDDIDGDGTVTIVDAHARFQYAGFRGQGMVLFGHLSDAQEISEVNARLPNTLQVKRTAVADDALAAWGEVGYDIAPYIGMNSKHMFSPFVRYDYYDTYYDTRSELADNGRYERRVLTGGVAYVYQEAVTLKLDYTYREFGESDIDSQNLVRLGLGFVY